MKTVINIKTAPLKPTRWLQRILSEADKDFREGKNIAGPFHSTQDLMKSLKVAKLL